MLTPQEVAQRSFSKASFGGYNMAMVDDFLDEVTADYESLYNENALLKQKLGVLSGKIREYQSTEEAMRKTLLAAQEMSDKLVKETQARCAQLEAEAESRSASRQSELAQSFVDEERKLQTARAAVETYKQQVRAICQRQLDCLDQLDRLEPPVVPVPPAVPDADSAAQAIHASLERDLAREEAERQADAPASESQPAPAPEPASEGEPPAAEPPAPPAPAVEESSVSLYEQLMAHRRAAQEPPQEPDPAEPTHRVERKSLEFGRDFEID